MHYPQTTERNNSRPAHALGPFRGFGICVIPLSIVGLPPPDLTTEPEIVVDDPDPGAILRHTGGCGHASGPPANHENIEIEMVPRFPGHWFDFSVLTFMPCLHKTWQLRECGMPSIATRHS